MASSNTIMTSAEVAEFLRIHPSTVYKLLRLGTLPAFKIGSDWRFRRAAIEALIGKQQPSPDPSPVRLGSVAE